MNRALGVSLSFLLLAFLPGLTAASGPDGTDRARPNVVLMLADNLGFGDLSVYNGGTRGGILHQPRIRGGSLSLL